ncbi:MAG: ABC transporter permease subunit [Ignavibacteriae bacterium]|nr:ABC transporter permease subunit [Ignavibacteriota bacterium]
MSKTNIYIPKNYYVTFAFLSSLFFVYIILFEFILPINSIFPRPSILIESIPSLYKEYYFIQNFLFTVTLIYSSFIASYFLIKLFFAIIFRISNQFNKIYQILNSANYFLPIFLIFLFNIWFDNSILGEILFLLFITMGMLKSQVILNSNKVNEEYILSAQSLGLDQKEIISKIIWKNFQPQLFNVFVRNHFLIWTYSLIYEFINKTNGLGKLFYLTLKYDDFVILILTIIVLVISFVFFNYLMKLIKDKFFFWENFNE